jgi:ABC-type nitrate/sulfonate/bicarbonate transport system permease component
MGSRSARDRAFGLLQAGWVRPLILLLIIIVLWDLAIRVFHLPPYQVPAPWDVIVTLWRDGPELLSQSVPTTVATVLGFFPVVVSAVPGFKSLDPDTIDLARAMAASRWQVFRMVGLPAAMPAIFSGLKVSVTLAVVGAVVGEFVGANSGIGFVLQRSIGNFELPTMFAALVILAVLGVVLFWLVDVVERLVIPWHSSRRRELILAA